MVEGAGAPLPVDVAAEAFAALCDRAARTDLLVHIEFWPGSALDLADRRGGGRGGRPPERRPARRHVAPGAHARRHGSSLGAIPGDRIVAVQISDSAPVEEPEPDYLAAALTRRLVPGEGALDLVGFVRLLDVRACCAPIGVEVCSERLAAEPPETVARRAGDAMRAVLAAARRDGGHGSS